MRGDQIDGNGRRAAARLIRERADDGELPLVVHPEWSERFPWLFQGMTGAGAPGGAAFDLRLFGADGGPAGGPRVIERWRRLQARAGFERVVHARQLHGPRVTAHAALTPDCSRGLYLGPECDGHCADAAGILLTVATADCVPVSLVHPGRRAVALLHAGWRGVASGVLEEGVRRLAERFGADAGDLHLHLGPSICGDCYEVGPEVFGGLGLTVPPGPALLDLRAVLRSRARALGVPDDRMTTSAFCTKCGDIPFFSHRRGNEGRQVALLGIRNAREPAAP